MVRSKNKNRFLMALVATSLGLLSCNSPQSPDIVPVRLADKQATESTNQLYSSLFQLAEKGIMLGHQDDLELHYVSGESSNDSDIKTVCGDYPAVFGWDLGLIETGSPFNSDSISFESIKQSIRRAHRLGGIVTLSWQAPNLMCDNYANDSVYLMYLDRLAVFFADLKDENGTAIPLIFRPFHSVNAKQNSPGQYKQLWAAMVDYLRISKKINHLIYAYSAFNVKNLDEFMTYYPGNEYVDVVGSEVYFSLENDPDGEIFKQDLERNLSVITTFSKNNHKIPSITEIGLDGIRIFNFFSDYVYPIVTKYPVSYMLFWKNARNSHVQYSIPIPGHPACEDFVVFVNKPEILTCREI